MSWHRDTELAVRSCLDEARLAASWIDFTFDYGDTGRIDEIQASCDAAEAQLELEVGGAASRVALIIEDMTATMAYAELRMGFGDEEPPSEYDYQSTTTPAARPRPRR